MHEWCTVAGAVAQCPKPQDTVQSKPLLVTSGRLMAIRNVVTFLGNIHRNQKQWLPNVRIIWHTSEDLNDEEGLRQNSLHRRVNI